MSATLLLLLLAAQTPPAGPVPVRNPVPARTGAACPARWSGQPLTDGNVYDGPPEERAILKPEDGDGPDDGTAYWPWLIHTYRAGRQVWLSCSYGPGRTSYVRVERPVRICRYDERGHRVRLWCR